MTDLWTDTQSGSGMDKTYVVQTSTARARVARLDRILAALAEVKGIFEDLDGWVRRKLRLVSCGGTGNTREPGPNR